MPRIAVPGHSPRSERDLKILRGLAQRIDQADSGGYNNLGVLYFNKGMFQDAVAAFQRALDIDPSMEVAERNLEIARIGTGYYKERIKTLEDATRRDPADLAGRRELAVAYRNSGAFDKAVSELRRIYDSDPTDLLAIVELARCSRAAGSMDRALEWLARARILDPDNASVHFDLGELRYQRGENSEARASLEAAVRLNPGYAKAFRLLGLVYSEMGEVERAEAARSHSHALDPDAHDTQENLSLDRYHPARYGELQWAVTDRPESAHDGFLAHYNLGIELRQKGLYEDALRELETALDEGEDPDLARQAMAEIYLVSGRGDEAARIYTELLELQPESPKLWNEKGVSRHQAGDLKGAEECYRMALTGDGDYALAWNNLAVARLHQNDPAGAESCLATALGLRPDFGDAWCNQGLLHLRGAEPGASLAAYRKAVEVEPDSVAGWIGVGSVLLDTRNFEEARNAFARAVELDPISASAHYNLSFSLSNLGDFEGALRGTKRALELDPYYAPARFRLSIELQFEYAEVYAPELDGAETIGDGNTPSDFQLDGGELDTIFGDMVGQPKPGARNMDRMDEALRAAADFSRQGLFGEAAERFEAALADLNGQPWSSRHAQAGLGHATAMLRLRRIADAHGSLTAVLRAEPDNPDAVRLLGEIALESGDAVRALELFARSNALGGATPEDFCLVARAERAAGDPERATAALRKAIALDPEFVTARSDLARLLLVQGRLTEAADECAIALELAPHHQDTLLVAAELERRRGRHEVAISWLVELLSVDAAHLRGLLLLGLTLLDAKRFEDAIRALYRILHLDRTAQEPLYYIGVIMAEQQRYRDAMRYWRRAHEVNPETPLARSALGKVEAALDHARRKA
ncbi:MAG TPA: tetratricopeptide repeat protein [Longimicrobiaceae bacterium]|nr:tetratricopeptide repeat protein [Longimicrobiaceae bacterium]